MVLVKSILVQIFCLIFSASSCLIILSSHPTVWSITSEPGAQYCVADIFSCIFNLFIELKSNFMSLEKIFHGRCYSSSLSNQSHAYRSPEITWGKEVSLAPSSTVLFFRTMSFFTLCNTLFCLRFMPAYTVATSLCWGHLLTPVHFSWSFLCPSPEAGVGAFQMCSCRTV